METTPEKKGKGIVNTIFKVGVLVLMVAIVVLLLTQRRGNDEPQDEMAALEASVRAKLGQLENKSDEEIQAELNRVVDEGMFHIVINNNPVFQDGESEGNLKIENVPGNLYTMRVEITLDDTGEVVYDSGLIDPNYHIQTDVLTKVLSAGQYPATAVFYAYDPETMLEVGTVGADMTIHILN